MDWSTWTIRPGIDTETVRTSAGFARFGIADLELEELSDAIAEGGMWEALRLTYEGLDELNIFHRRVEVLAYRCVGRVPNDPEVAIYEIRYHDNGSVYGPPRRQGGNQL